MLFRSNALHYDRERWINADVPLKQLLGIWADQKLPPLPFQQIPEELFATDAARRAAEFMLLQEPLLLSAFNALRGFVPTLRRFSQVLIDERNQAAIAAFDAVPADQDVLIIYGAGHAGGLLDALRERWYWRQAETWHTAFRGEPVFGGRLGWLRELVGIG